MNPLRIGYLRLSRDDGKGQSIENQKKALLAYDDSMTLFTDNGVSGETNLTDPNSAWSTKLIPFLQQHPTAELCVYSLDRLGRKKGKVLSAIEDLIDNGGTLYVVRDRKLYDDPEDFSQGVQLTFESLSNEAYRVEIQKKTKRALSELQKAGVTLGRRPTLTEKDIVEIQKLRARGLGYTSIGKVVRTKRVKDGKEQDTAPRTIKAVLTGSYISREEWELKNAEARRSMRRRRA
ncbi:recombinase family protein [Microbacterium sp. KR10-403]|uniref:recombinase family protein n=1 Tax=Microbacterium sp. KR10-403 TaxID=3158581 RepID=UPI0032E4077D